MPSILKHFLNHPVVPYRFPAEEELVEETEPTVPETAKPEDEAPAPEPTPAQATLDYAKAQAEAILQDARARAEEEAWLRLEQAEQEAAKALEAARSNGYRQGYAEGMVAAMTEARARQDEEGRKLRAEVQTFLDKAQIARDAMMDGAVGELKDLSMAIAEKVIRISLKSSGDIIGRMIMAAIEKLKRKEWVHIYIAGCDARSMTQVSPELSAALAGLSDRVRIIPMAEDESGACIIEMNDEIIDASASTQLANLRAVLDSSPRGESEPLQPFMPGF